MLFFVYSEFALLEEKKKRKKKLLQMCCKVLSFFFFFITKDFLFYGSKHSMKQEYWRGCF